MSDTHNQATEALTAYTLVTIRRRLGLRDETDATMRDYIAQWIRNIRKDKPWLAKQLTQTNREYASTWVDRYNATVH
jgi:hypothetical protein